MSPRVQRIDRGGWGDEPIRQVWTTATERDVGRSRPTPPDAVGDEELTRFVPDLRFAEWIRETFVVPDGALADEEHEHLLDASIGVLWTNCINIRQQRHILATAEMPQTMGGAWKRGRADQQLRDWFEAEPNFLITFYAPEVRLLDDRAFCALVKHEILHCAQAQDSFGSPRFGRMGEPIYAMRGHDSEEFVSVVDQFGLGAVSDGTRRLVAAANRAPSIPALAIATACGTCVRSAA